MSEKEMFPSLRIPVPRATHISPKFPGEVYQYVSKPTHSCSPGHSGVQKTLTPDELYMPFP
jgi:hypothetical protein